MVLQGSLNIQKGPVNLLKEKALICDGWGAPSCLISFSIFPPLIFFLKFSTKSPLLSALLPFFDSKTSFMKHLLFWRGWFFGFPRLDRLTLPPWGKRAPNLVLKLNPRSPDSVFKVIRLSLTSCKKSRVHACVTHTYSLS